MLYGHISTLSCPLMIVISCFPNKSNCTAQRASQKLSEAFPFGSAQGFEHLTTHALLPAAKVVLCCRPIFRSKTALAVFLFSERGIKAKKRSI